MLLCHGIGLGYYAGIQPITKWRFFSWHPLLLTLGMIAIPGIGAVTKKMGGYTNTKVWRGVCLVGLLLVRCVCV